MEKENTQPMKDKRHNVSAVELDAFISELQENKSPKIGPTTPELRAATRLQALTSDDTIDAQFSLQLKQDIIHSLKDASGEETKKEKRRFTWKMLLLPIAPLGVTAAAIIVAIQFNQPNTPESVAPVSVAEVPDDAPSLLLGAPVISETQDTEDRVEGEGYTIDYVEFQRKLNERSSTGNLVEVGDVGDYDTAVYKTGELALEEEEETSQENKKYFYSDLRLDAYGQLAIDAEITELLAAGGLDVSGVLDHIEEMEKTMQTWPTDDMPFDSEAYSEAINDLVQHNTGWNRLMKEVTDELVRDYQKKNPDWSPGQPIEQ